MYTWSQVSATTSPTTIAAFRAPAVDDVRCTARVVRSRRTIRQRLKQRTHGTISPCTSPARTTANARTHDTIRPHTIDSCELIAVTAKRTYQVLWFTCEHTQPSFDTRHGGKPKHHPSQKSRTRGESPALLCLPAAAALICITAVPGACILRTVSYADKL